MKMYRYERAHDWDRSNGYHAYRTTDDVGIGYVYRSNRDGMWYGNGFDRRDTPNTECSVGPHRTRDMAAREMSQHVPVGWEPKYRL